MELVLASASPRRRELLASLGLAYRCEPGAALDEAALLAGWDGSLPERLMQLAAAKGEAPAGRFPSDLVLSADTEVLLDGECLGKPADAPAAHAMLLRLSGRSHLVCTAVALQCAAHSLHLQGYETTEVSFAKLDQLTIETYVTRTQPFDFAGGYAIQGLGALLVASINGDYSNVVGLPLRLTAHLLGQAGMHLL